MRLLGKFVLAAGLTIATALPALADGSLMIVGGELRFDNAQIWQKMVDLSGGEGARIAVIGAASSSPQKNGQLAVDTFDKYGADAFLVPLSPKQGKFDVDYRTVREDPRWVEEIAKSGGVYFIGGAQERITQSLLEDDGSDSPLLAAIRRLYADGGMVGGTSAGAAIMSDPMFRDAQDVFKIMKDGMKMGQEIDHGLGFMPKDWFVDQHFLARGRFARSLVAMRDLGFVHGIGVDENTAALVTDGSELEVLGYRGVVYMDLADATWQKEGLFNLKNARLSYLDHGDRMNLRTLEVTPSPQKLADLAVDPNDPDYEPYYTDYQFFPDMLGSWALYDLMVNLVDNTNKSADGLAMRKTGPDARVEGGYAFHFYQGPDTHGWYTGSFGAEDYTSLNIHLDISPVTVVPSLTKAN